MDDYPAWAQKAVQKDKAFAQIFTGGIIRGRHLELRCQVAEENGHLIYNGKRYTARGRWRPAKVIRRQGRLAKELPNPYNNRPEISVELESGKVLRLDACPCGGELIMDHRLVLYCRECFRIYE
jgi:hypothetical protein